MDARAIMEVLGVLVVAFIVGVLLPLTLTFLFVKYRGGSEEMHQTIAALKAGKIDDLLPWDSGSLGELTREWVGSATYTASMFGRNDQSAGRVPSSRVPSGWLLAFGLETKNDGADGRVLAMTSAHRIELRIERGVCKASVNGTVLGSFKLGEAPILAPDGSPLGSYRRGQLEVRGRDAATLDTRTASVSARAEAPGPLITSQVADRTPEDEAWTLVVAVLQLARVGPSLG